MATKAKMQAFDSTLKAMPQVSNDSHGPTQPQAKSGEMEARDDGEEEDGETKEEDVEGDREGEEEDQRSDGEQVEATEEYEPERRVPESRDGAMYTGVYGRARDLRDKMIREQMALIRCNPVAFQEDMASQADAKYR